MEGDRQTRRNMLEEAVRIAYPDAENIINRDFDILFTHLELLKNNASYRHLVYTSMKLGDKENKDPAENAPNGPNGFVRISFNQEGCITSLKFLRLWDLPIMLFGLIKEVIQCKLKISKLSTVLARTSLRPLS